MRVLKLSLEDRRSETKEKLNKEGVVGGQQEAQTHRECWPPDESAFPKK